MIPIELKLVGICDDLLSSTGELGHLVKKSGGEWPCAQAATLIDRILDVRNQVSPPTPPKTKKTTTNTNHINGHAKQ